MLQFTDINYIKLRNIIGKLPPGRARKKYEATLGGLLGKGGVEYSITGNIVENRPASGPPRLTLTVTSRREIPPPIRLTPWVIVDDPNKFIETTLGDLASYVEAESSGSRHWVRNLLKEKLEHLERCGVKAEIRTIQ